MSRQPQTPKGVTYISRHWRDWLMTAASSKGAEPTNNEITNRI